MGWVSIPCESIYERPTDELRQVMGTIEWKGTLHLLGLIGCDVPKSKDVIVKVQRKWFVKPDVFRRAVGPPDIHFSGLDFEWRDLPTVTEEEFEREPKLVRR